MKPAIDELLDAVSKHNPEGSKYKSMWQGDQSHDDFLLEVADHFEQINNTTSTFRQRLFKGFNGCSNHGCVITGPKNGVGTNGQCKCLRRLDEAGLAIIQSRLYGLLNELETTV